jgi:DHA1 family multidrug resistance protein-like MFS transporter
MAPSPPADQVIKPGNTINPHTHPSVPIIGNGFFVWGASMVNSSIIPYLFDSFAPAGTLGAITAQAVGRLLAAAWLPLVILFDLTSLGPKWGLGALGFISLAFWPIPPILFVYGTKWRRESKYMNM